MPLQDLTPQLRTRLNRVERAVGWFIMIATLLLIVGIGFYIYKTAENRGWFKIKAQYYIYTDRGDGLTVGNPVYLMGFPVGHILEVTPMPPTWGRPSSNNVYVRFDVEEPNFGYIWTDSSRVQFRSSFLGSRQIDISKGLFGFATYINYEFRPDLTLDEAKALPHPEEWRLGQEIREGTNTILAPWKPLTNNWDLIGRYLGTNTFPAIHPTVKKRNITAVWNETTRAYEEFRRTNIYSLPRYEEVALNDQLQAMVLQVKAALPSFLDLTNKLNSALGNLNTTLANASQLTSNFNTIAVNAKPAVANLAIITGNLTNANGSLGQWVIPTNLNQRLDTTVDTVNAALTNLDTNLATLNLTLQNLGNITSNLNNQVQANTNILSNVSGLVVHSDQFIQGMKHFWLFRHTFAKENKTNAPPATKH